MCAGRPSSTGRPACHPTAVYHTPPGACGTQVGVAVTPKRNVRMGPLWDLCAQAATDHGETMTAFVERALEAELRRVNTQALCAEVATTRPAE